MTLSTNCATGTARTLVAKILLDQAADRKQHQLAQRDMATLGSVDWEIVNTTLKSLQNEGAIRIERNRIIINKILLKKAAGAVHSR
jgi:hypothetical protein